MILAALRPAGLEPGRGLPMLRRRPERSRFRLGATPATLMPRHGEHRRAHCRCVISCKLHAKVLALEPSNFQLDLDALQDALRIFSQHPFLADNVLLTLRSMSCRSE